MQQLQSQLFGGATGTECRVPTVGELSHVQLWHTFREILAALSKASSAFQSGSNERGVEAAALSGLPNGGGLRGMPLEAVELAAARADAVAARHAHASTQEVSSKLQEQLGSLQAMYLDTRRQLQVRVHLYSVDSMHASILHP